MSSKRICIFTNGHGEDEIALSMIHHLLEYDVSVFPLVGDGKVFSKRGIKVIFKGKNFFSGGLLLREGLSSLYKDFKEGFFFDFLNIIKQLRELNSYDFIPLVVGDLYPLILLYIFAKKRAFLVLSSRSVRMGPFKKYEFFFLKKMAKKIFARDIDTKKKLRLNGIDALYLGNPVVGERKDGNFFFKKDKKGLLFLPGSRKDLYKNVNYMLEIINEIINLKRDASFRFMFHFAESTSWKSLASRIPRGWIFIDGKEKKLLKKNNNLSVSLLKGVFFESLQISDVVVGLSGTANEQAVAMGKPVIAFPIPGTHATHKRFTKRQKPLLGENLIYFPCFEPGEIAKKIIKVAFDKDYLLFLRVRGRETIGRNGIISITNFLKNTIKEDK